MLQFITEDNALRDSMQFRERSGRGARDSFGERALTTQLVLGLQRLTQPVSGNAVLRSCAIEGQTYTFFWARGGSFGVVFVPSKLRVLGPVCLFPAGSDLSNGASHLGPLRHELWAWSKLGGSPLLDLTEPLQAATRSGRIPWLWGDTHWNSEGHAIASGTLSAWEAVRAARAR